MVEHGDQWWVVDGATDLWGSWRTFDIASRALKQVRGHSHSTLEANKQIHYHITHYLPLPNFKFTRKDPNQAHISSHAV
jgi:hypothetical protein